jgi:prepilin-type N-terminal cleavage/methylation domain-containing protein
MSHKNSKSNGGFTIIEVLIVLAIAGLIMLIVFLAVPALQRNSRNTATKNDVQNVLGGIAEFQGANNGRMPDTIGGTGKIDYALTSGGNATSINVQGSTLVTSSKTTTTVPATVNAGEILVVIGKKCPTSGNSLVSSTRAAAAIYSIETSSQSVVQCQDS